MRWHDIGPIGLPHRLTEDDIYNGHVTLKGSIIVNSINLVLSLLALCHGSTEYKHPMTFDPSASGAIPPKAILGTLASVLAVASAQVGY
ncbi:hypothetical protein BJY01DRAFT_216219 [Aspergillus pseudoustus]|uniref:Amino acid permease/ SLC12A domain-containing protein n=1 Tax=Aspergillus pseudoustus TaxID=1810923 RepID=A0ABR4JS89_9EURO